MDTNAYFRKDTVGAMTATFVSTALEVGPMTHPIALEVIVPACVSGDTLVAKLSFSDTDTLGEKDFLTGQSISAAGRYMFPFYTHYHYAFLTLTATDAATATALAFGAVVAKIVPCGYDEQK